MLAVYVILAIVVSCVTIVATYFLLNAEGEQFGCGSAASLRDGAQRFILMELSVSFCSPFLAFHVRPLYLFPPRPLLHSLLPADHRWAWHAFWSGASVALYVFIYSVYYFLFRTE